MLIIIANSLRGQIVYLGRMFSTTPVYFKKLSVGRTCTSKSNQISACKQTSEHYPPLLLQTSYMNDRIKC